MGPMSFSHEAISYFVINQKNMHECEPHGAWSVLFLFSQGKFIQAIICSKIPVI